ncbi:MAG: iron-containing alcohol dehydrogenase [Candidatus Saccharibacteria bacterium]|nr:iron-containing alcohol dehydrogenase [Candidatus Saccharibacteria bacterium]
MHKLKITGLENVIHVGDEFEADLSKIIDIYELKNRNAVLFTGQKSFSGSGYLSDLKKLLREKGIKNLYHKTIEANPKKTEIDEVVNYLDKSDCDLLLAIGGGSVIDFAKACRLYSKKNYTFLTIYTRLGSGSIVSPFTVYDNHEFKIGDHSETILPDMAYVNTHILTQLSEEVIGAGICDIYGHAVESALSKLATATSRRNSSLALGYLEKYFATNSLLDVLYADIHAALAEKIGIVLLPHALGHYVTYKYKISHGYANFLFTGAFLQWLKDCGIIVPQDQERMYDLIKVRFGKLINSHNIKMIDAADIALIEDNMGFAMSNSPLALSKIDIKNIFNQGLAEYHAR